MSELVAIVKAWPVLLQGAMGSAIFWLVLIAGQWLTASFISSYSKRSKIARESYLISAMYKFRAFSTDDHALSAFYVAALLLRAFRPLLKSFMWLAVGLILNSLMARLGTVAYLASLYYLFKSYSVISPYSRETDLAAEAAKVEEELESLGGLNKSPEPTPQSGAA